MPSATQPTGFLKPHHDRLNVIQIMCDQLPYDALGSYGHKLVQTPNLDALAERGMRFTNAYAQSTVCCPSRASQLSGLYPSNHGILSNMNNLEIINPQVRFLSDRFYEEGYATAHFGKWHCLRDHRECKFTEFKFLEESVPIWPQQDIRRFYRDDEDPNFLMYGPLVHAATHPCGEDDTGPARITDYSLDFMERFAYKPFFLRVSYLGPHAPTLVPRPYDTLIDPDDVELPDYAYEEIANRPQVVQDFQARCIENRRATPDGISPEEAIRIHVAYNLGLISHIDNQIGRLLSAVERLGLSENTVLLFTTDHGSFWGEHGLLKKSPYLHYRALLQLPLIISCPGRIPEGQTYDGFIEEVDFYPTLLNLAGIENDRRVNGRSFKDAVLGGDDPGREDVFAECLWGENPVASLRNADWHFIWHARTQETELYDMHADPEERINVAHRRECQLVIQERTARLLSRLMENRDVELLPFDEDIQRSPIYLTPGRDERAHEEALIRRFRGDRSADEFPVSS